MNHKLLNLHLESHPSSFAIASHLSGQILNPGSMLRSSWWQGLWKATSFFPVSTPPVTVSLKKGEITRSLRAQDCSIAIITLPHLVPRISMRCFLDLFGSVWIVLDLFGSFWIFLDRFGSFWIFLDLFGSFWIFLGSFWIFLDRFRSFWIFLDLFGSF